MTSTTPDARWAVDLLRSMASRGTETAFTDGVAKRSHTESHARAVALARDLGARGIGPGDRVALVVESTADAVEGYLAVNLVGATSVQVNDRLAAPEVAEILGLVGPRALLHTAAHADRLADLTAGAGIEVVGLGDGVGRPLDVVSGARAPYVAVDPGAPSIIGFTSGTTGRPKGVVHTHDNLGRIVRYMPIHNHLGWGSRLAMTGTLAFAAGIWGVVLPHLYLGGTISWMAGLPAEEWVDRMVRERSTFTYCPTPLFGAFTAAVAQRPEVLESLSSVLHSGSAATREATAALVEVVGGRFTETYGMTETGSPVTTTGPDDWAPWSRAEDALASAGRVIPLARVAVLGEDGEPVAPGAEGELVVETPFAFDGYWEDPEQTAEALVDGRVHTGDRGRLDEAGFLYVLGRSKDMIVSGGMNVYPAEVERVLAQADAVADVAVFGVAHERWGETVAAAVVARAGESVDVEAVMAFARERLAGYKKPTVVHVVDELPRNANLKVRKDVLRERFR